MNTKKLSIKDICFISIFTALTAVFAQIAIQIPISPVPISFGVVAVYMTGIFLPPKCALCSQICYVLLGAAGAPVFGNFKGGLAALFGFTGGYLMTYPIVALLISYTLNSRKALANENNKFKVQIKSILVLLVSLIIFYAAGSLWISIISKSTFGEAISLAVLPYIPLDIIKIVFCVLAIIPLRRRFMVMGLLNFSVESVRERINEESI